jgi:hypothetical protein
MATDLTTEFLAGYHAIGGDAENPHLWSSPAWLAFRAGAQFVGLGAPIKCMASRGNSLRVYVGSADYARRPSLANARQMIATPGDDLNKFEFAAK